MENIVYLFISDLHLGSNHCDVKKLMEIFKSIPHRKLFIVGDLFDGNRVIPEYQQKIIDHIARNRRKVIFIKGNHDSKEWVLVLKRLGVKVLKKCFFKIKGKKFCVMHGDRFDDGFFGFLFSLSWIDKAFSFMIKIVKMIHIKGYGLNLIIDWLHQKFDSSIAKRAVKYARKYNAKKCDNDGNDVIVICGHTHFPTIENYFDKNGRKIVYANCGTPSKFDGFSFITVDQNGNLTLHKK